MKNNKIKCRFCGTYFTPSPYNKHSQKYCNCTAECRAASRRASQKKYRDKQIKNDPEFRKKECQRVKKWQKKNPDYWKKQKKCKKNSGASVLRDIAQAQNLNNFEVLRDTVITNQIQFMGLIEHIFDLQNDGVLRDIIDTKLNSLYDKGKSFYLSKNFKSERKEFYSHEEGNCKSEAAAEYSGGLRLGGP